MLLIFVLVSDDVLETVRVRHSIDIHSSIQVSKTELTSFAKSTNPGDFDLQVNLMKCGKLTRWKCYKDLLSTYRFPCTSCSIQFTGIDIIVIIRINITLFSDTGIKSRKRHQISFGCAEWSNWYTISFERSSKTLSFSYVWCCHRYSPKLCGNGCSQRIPQSPWISRSREWHVQHRNILSRQRSNIRCDSSKEYRVNQGKKT